MAVDLPLLRALLYGIFATLSVILASLSSARIHYTTHIAFGEPLDADQGFYDPAVAEVLFTALLSVMWATYMVYVIVRRREDQFLSTLRSEIAGLVFLFILWLAGASAASATLHKCRYCHLLSPLTAISWLGWLVVLALLTMSFLFGVANDAWTEPLHGRYDPRASVYPEDSREETCKPGL